MHKYTARVMPRATSMLSLTESLRLQGEKLPKLNKTMTVRKSLFLEINLEKQTKKSFRDKILLT